MMERHYATKARSSFRNSKTKCQRQMLTTYVRRWKMCDKPWPLIPQTRRTSRPRRKSYRSLHGKLHSRLISRVAAVKRHRKAKKRIRMKRSDQSSNQQNNTLVKFETDADRMRCLFFASFLKEFSSRDSRWAYWRWLCEFLLVTRQPFWEHSNQFGCSVAFS